MPLDILTPKHSFVRFDGGLADMVMPVFDTPATVAFQFMIPAGSETPDADTLYIGIADMTDTSLLESAVGVSNICYWGRMTGINWNTDFPLNYGAYATAADLFEVLRDIYHLSCNSADFLQCCDPRDDPITFDFVNAAGTAKTLTITFYKGLQQAAIPDDPANLFANIPVAIDECFKFYIRHGTDKVYSNTFKRTGDNKFLTNVTYSSNEDAYGFNFPSTEVFNQIWLPLYSKNPRYPETRKVYIKSDKSYKVQSATIEKEFECKTDRLVDEMHEKITVMLAMDNVYFLNTKIDSSVTKKSEDYAIDWSADDHIGSESAIATFKVLQPFEGRNSNCEKKAACADSSDCTPIAYSHFVLPDGAVGIFYNHNITLGGDPPFVLSAVTKPSWMTILISANIVYFTGTPDAAVTDTPVGFTISNCGGTNSLDFSDLISVIDGTPPVAEPSLTETSNTDTGPGGTRTQVFAVGSNIAAGNKFYVEVYSHEVSVTAAGGDTQATISAALRDAVNATTESEWNSAGSAPAAGTTGFKPTATASGSSLTIILNYGNQFASGATIS